MSRYNWHAHWAHRAMRRQVRATMLSLCIWALRRSITVLGLSSSTSNQSRRAPDTH